MFHILLSSTPIRVLSLIWLGLCTFLVLKHNELIAVFISFSVSFLSASVISSDKISLMTTILKKEDNLSKNMVSSNVKTKKIIGLLACTLAFLVLILDVPSMLKLQLSSEFYALCIVTGYLAFDLWYDRIFCRSHPTQLFSILEDATTLIIFCTTLARWENFTSADGAATKIAVWLAYRTIRHAAYLATNVQERNTTRSSKNKSIISLSQKASQMTKESIQNENVGSVVNRELNKSLLWTIHGEDYDLREFVKRHPGGKEAILLGQGRDCTALFESYHPFTNKHRDILKKHKVVTTSGPNEVRASPIKEDEFYAVLKNRVRNSLLEHGIDPEKDRCATFMRSVYYFVIMSLVIVSGSYHLKASPLGSFFFALFGWLVGSLGHDAGHFAASRIPIINDICVWGMSLLCNPMMWQIQHTYAHHSHTNDFDHDPDLHHFEIFLRVHRRFKHESIYKNQRNVLYVALAYALVVFGECIKIPLDVIKTGSLYGMVEFTDRKRPLRAFGLSAHYAGYLAIIVVGPFFAGRSWWVSLLCAVIHIATAGWLFAIFSQINHLNESSLETNKSTTDSKLLRESWAATQVVTSNNFHLDSLFWHILSNGLNMQIEHHLFPGLNHCHLHLIAPVVRKTCGEFGVEYKCYDSWYDVMQATLKWLEKLSVHQDERGNVSDLNEKKNVKIM